ncbi:MAG: KH domain-containing protein [Candidatus Moranbacteria bacterium]|nr:KH domain-containing protein [Candidatus Moranbacteria bacterium]
MDEKITSTIKKTIEELITKMGFSGEVTIAESTEADSVTCDITTDVDSNFLIGQHGINLQALQHLARLIVRKHIPEKIRFTLDINKYRQQKNQSIIEQAKFAAREAISQGRSVFMDPMTTYERRIVHLELSTNPEVRTESVGEGESRKIVIKPANMIE